MTDITRLTQSVQSFCEARDWDQYHNPKDLAIGISTEANELLDLFRFKNDQDMAAILADPIRRTAVGQELADVFFFLLRFAQMNRFDLAAELDKKMALNEAKYPISDSKGNNRKYNDKD